MYQAIVYNDEYGDKESAEVSLTFEGAVQKVFDAIGVDRKYKVDAVISKSGSSLAVTKGDMTIATIGLVDPNVEVSSSIMSACNALANGDMDAIAGLFTTEEVACV